MLSQNSLYLRPAPFGYLGFNHATRKDVLLSATTLSSLGKLGSI